MEVVKSSKVIDGQSAMIESDLARDLMQTLLLLGVNKPSSETTAKRLFSSIKEKVQEKLKNSPEKKNEKPLLLEDGTKLPPHSWDFVDKTNKALHDDYKVRRQMLISRCDCTVESFKWKKLDKKDNEDLADKIDQTYTSLRQNLDPEPQVTMITALAARESGCFDLLNAVISKSPQISQIETPQTKGMANSGMQQRISLQKYLIGQVPDRGGRPREQPPPLKETFQQQKQQRYGRGGGGRGGGRRSDHGSNQRNNNQHRGHHGGGDFDKYGTPHQQNYGYHDQYVQCQSNYNPSHRGGRGGRGQYQSRSHYNTYETYRSQY